MELLRINDDTVEGEEESEVDSELSTHVMKLFSNLLVAYDGKSCCPSTLYHILLLICFKGLLM
jgi:hypothetical protein